MKNTLKRILAVIGIILILGMYFTTLILAIFNIPGTTAMLNASIIATVFIPILLYVLWMIYKMIKKSDSDISPK
jgi:ACR3 family arsenite efflux pump ArsB